MTKAGVVGLLLLGGCDGGGSPGAESGSGGAEGGPGGSSSGSSPTTSAAATGAGSGAVTGVDTGATTGEDSADPPGSSGPPPISLDLGGIPDAPPPVCGEGGGDLSLSYIWIANSSQGTISKIDTATMVEEGRYQAKPFNGDPSRTSVNLLGDVAVANRNGGVAKFWANEEDCVESNGIPGIQTSTGSGDVLPWGDDECLAWYHDLSCGSNRPVAWTRGVFDEAACTYEGMALWTVCDDEVLLLDGETGDTLQSIILPGGLGSAFVYGGAADADGNFWGLDYGSGTMFRVDGESFDVQSWGLPPTNGYGITVDSVGRPWLCGGGGVSRFNLDSSTWDSAGGSGIGGCMTDGADLIWHSDGGGRLLGFNIETLDIDEEIQLPEYVHGVSVDFQGLVWGVSFAGSTAYRADPATDTVDTFNGLVGAYTYSDMTGFALSTAGGGGVPPS